MCIWLLTEYTLIISIQLRGGIEDRDLLDPEIFWFFPIVTMVTSFSLKRQVSSLNLMCDTPMVVGQEPELSVMWIMDILMMEFTLVIMLSFLVEWLNRLLMEDI